MTASMHIGMASLRSKKPGALLLVGLLAAAAAVAAASCAVFGDFSLSSGTSGGPPSDAGPSDAGPCAAGEVCFATPPGFSAVLPLDEPLFCPEGWGNTFDAERLDGPNQPQCGCFCLPTWPDCSQSKIVFYKNAACTVVDFAVGPAASCAGLPKTVTDPAAKVVPVISGAPTCGAPETSELPFKPTTKHVSLCTPTNAGAPCGLASTCTPSVPGAACVLASGDKQCPAGFASRTVLSTGGFSDQSTCDAGACQPCTAVMPAMCFPAVNFVASGPACTNNQTCVDVTCSSLVGVSGLNQYELKVIPSPPDCSQPSNVPAMASIVPNNPLTLCCQ
jgi:hypothetical protein